MKKIIVWTLAVLLGMTAIKYGKSEDETALKAEYPRRMDIVDVLTVNGTVKENNRKDLYVDDTAEILSVYVKEGDRVSAGDVLATIKPKDTLGGISVPSEYVVNAVLGGGMGEAFYTDSQSGYIKSPIDGTVMSVNFSEGDSVSPIVPLFSVSDLDNLGIAAQINEDSAHKIREGMEADILPTIKDHKTLKGRITAIKPYAVKTVNILSTKENPAKTSFELDILNDDSGLKPGYSVTLKLATDSRENALVIPYEYILQDDANEQYVYVLGNDGVPEIRYIETGYELETVCEVREGLSENDLLLMHDEGTENGQAVSIRVKNADN